MNGGHGCESCQHFFPSQNEICWLEKKQGVALIMNAELFFSLLKHSSAQNVEQMFVHVSNLPFI